METLNQQLVTEQKFNYNNAEIDPNMQIFKNENMKEHKDFVNTIRSLMQA